jgi:hypothetical protein
MKKYLVCLLVFVFIVTFTAAPKTVNAVPHPNGFTPKPEVWEWYGEDVTGEEIPMYKITTTPREWYQLRSTGLKVDGATRICHGFDDGRYGWTGEIFRLVEDAWVKLPTTVGWVPTEEGHYMACAFAPAAGTYALFGYFDKAKAPVKEVLPKCVQGRDVGTYGYTWIPPDDYYNFHIDLLPAVAGIPVFIEVIPITGSFSGFVSAHTLSDAGGFVFTPNHVYVDSFGPFAFIVRFTTPSCYYNMNFGGNITF